MVSSLTPYPRCVGIFAGLPTLHVSACFCNQDTHFNDNDKGLKTQAFSVIEKKFWRSLIHILICFQSLGSKYLHDMNIRFGKVGRGNLVDWNSC